MNEVVQNLNVISRAKNYNQFLYQLLQPYLQGDVFEIGSGIGNLTIPVLQSQRITSITCLEPEEDCRNILHQKLIQQPTPFEILPGYFPEQAPNHKKFDVIFSYNVLEHIQNDFQAILTSYQLLKPNGILFIYVPACQWIYGPMDAKLCHYRRYSKQNLRQKLRQAKFHILKIRYYNFVGFWGWLITNKIFKNEDPNPKQVVAYDKYIFPIQNKVEKHLEPPFGQNLVAIAQKII
ncbi:MAG: class I SAM-dependent methyltransferase [Planctomycetota bacterium]|nr:MAG: class I SAM-dependent methyltransferase [Planctomycetota bacterium]